MDLGSNATSRDPLDSAITALRSAADGVGLRADDAEAVARSIAYDLTLGLAEVADDLTTKLLDGETLEDAELIVRDAYQ